jgi:hypothetical protein
MKNSQLLFFFIIAMATYDWLGNVSEIELWGVMIVLAISTILFQLEDMEEEL